MYLNKLNIKWNIQVMKISWLFSLDAGVRMNMLFCNEHELNLQSMSFLCFVFAVPPRKLTILGENGTNVQQKRVIGPYTEGSTAQITCVAAGGKYFHKLHSFRKILTREYFKLQNYICNNLSRIYISLCTFVGLEVLTAVSTKMAVFWVVAPCSLVEVYQRFRGSCCLHHKGATAQKTAIFLCTLVKCVMYKHT
jgi:hypothetical protein